MFLVLWMERCKCLSEIKYWRKKKPAGMCTCVLRDRSFSVTASRSMSSGRWSLQDHSPCFSSLSHIKIIYSSLTINAFPQMCETSSSNETRVKSMLMLACEFTWEQTWTGMNFYFKSHNLSLMCDVWLCSHVHLLCGLVFTGYCSISSTWLQPSDCIQRARPTAITSRLASKISIM